MATTTTARTTTEGLEAARRTYRGDWDENGTVSVHLPSEIAVQLLEARGWRRATNGRWDAPALDAKGKLVFAWDRDEALQIALAAEVA